MPLSLFQGSLGRFARCGAGDVGLTVVELTITMLVMAITTAIALPMFSDMNDSFERMNTRSNLIQDLKRAQAESLTRGCRGIFSFASDGRSYSFGCDFLEYDSASPPSPDRVSFRRTMPTGITITASSQIIFSSRGDSVDEVGTIRNVTLSLVFTEGASTSSYFGGTILGTGLFSES